TRPPRPRRSPGRPPVVRPIVAPWCVHSLSRGFRPFTLRRPRPPSAANVDLSCVKQVTGNRDAVLSVQPGMRRLATVALLIALVPVGCAAPVTAPGPGPGSPTGSASGSPPSPAGGRSDAGCAQGVQTGTVTLTEADHGRIVCVSTGTDVAVYLRAPRPGQH